MSCDTDPYYMSAEEERAMEMRDLFRQITDLKDDLEAVRADRDQLMDAAKLARTHLAATGSLESDGVVVAILTRAIGDFRLSSNDVDPDLSELSPEDQEMVDRAWKRHAAALPNLPASEIRESANIYCAANNEEIVF